MVAGADHLVEVHPAVEEAPGHVAHGGTQEGVGGDQVRADLTLGRPLDAGEVFVAGQGEGAEAEAAVAGDRVGLAGFDFVEGEDLGRFEGFGHGHGEGSPCNFYLKQMSAHFSTESGPLMVCCRITPGLALS
ncbi:hypothetical protein D3C81_1623030 [compost metagenome]